MQATATDFLLRASVKAYENGKVTAVRDWRETIPRDLL
jgi:uncharacterized protein